MHRSHRSIALALAAAVALTAAGCADDSPPTRVRDGRVKVALDDFSIAPQRIRAAPGRVTFAVGTASGRFAKGDYDLVCVLGNHDVLGMYGTLTVR